jgi:hypothetical protein
MEVKLGLLCFWLIGPPGAIALSFLKRRDIPTFCPGRVSVVRYSMSERMSKPTSEMSESSPAWKMGCIRGTITALSFPND